MQLHQTCSTYNIICYIGFVGFNYTTASSGEHTLTVRATSSSNQVLEIPTTLTMPQLVVDIMVTSKYIIICNSLLIIYLLHAMIATQNIAANTRTYSYTTSQNFPVQCRINGGNLFPCKITYCSI